MGSFSESNLSEVLEYPFDFSRYIEERLREIDDLDEREFAKIILLEGLSKVIRCTEQKYQELERRVYEEIEIPDNCYQSVLTVVKREHYDPTNGTLRPVILDDLEPETLREQFSEQGQNYLGTIFLRASEKDMHRFEEMEAFPGTVEGNGEKKETVFPIKPARRYRDMVETIYRAFQDNHIPWETINTGYLDKFYDVFADDTENSGAENGGTDEAGMMGLDQADIHFGEFQPLVQTGIIPLWNIEWITFDSANFMLPCINGIYYEHEFSLEDKESEDGYLIKTNEDILEIRHEKGKIAIKSQKETFEGWKAMRMIQKKTVRSLDYVDPLLTNRKNDTFFRRYSEKSRVRLMTKTDLFRRIMELDIREYVEAVGYEICENAREYPAAEGMNWFVRDELFPMESRKVLLLKFEEKIQGHYLSDSMVRFVISQMQLEVGEYRCVGVLI